MLEAGPLPDTSVFVMEIVDDADPSRDVLLRVAQVPDFFTYPNMRTSALATGSQYYRSVSVSVDYNDLTVASDAARAFKDRTNQLVSDWITYEYKFKHVDPGSLYLLPTGDLSGIAQLIGAWQAAQLAEVTSNGVLNTATATKESAQAAYDAAGVLVSTLQTYSQLIVDLDAQSDALGSLLGQLRTAKAAMGVAGFPYAYPFPINGVGVWQGVSDLLNAIGLVTLSLPAFDNPLYAPITALKAASDAFVNTSGVPYMNTVTDAAFGQYGMEAGEAAYRNETTRLTTFNAAVQAAITAKGVAQTALNAANSAVATAQSNATAATVATAAALGAIVMACPVFDPNNPTAVLNS
jgi:hypothetical protein